MIEVSKKKWESIPGSYKGKWESWLKSGGWQPDLPEEYIGRRTVLEGCITDHAGTSLLTEGVHFIITK